MSPVCITAEVMDRKTCVARFYGQPKIDWVGKHREADKIVFEYLRVRSDPTVVKTRPNFHYPKSARYTGTGKHQRRIDVMSRVLPMSPSYNSVWLGKLALHRQNRGVVRQRAIGVIGKTFKCGLKLVESRPRVHVSVFNLLLKESNRCTCTRKACGRLRVNLQPPTIGKDRPPVEL